MNKSEMVNDKKTMSLQEWGKVMSGNELDEIKEKRKIIYY